MAISESNARGVAVVAPRAFGIKHMVVDGRNGLFLPESDDLNAKAAILRRALDYSWDRAAIAAQARFVYSPETVARRTFEAYQSILQADRKPRALRIKPALRKRLSRPGEASQRRGR